MAPRMKNESGESKKNVICGICGLSARRDNMKRYHFPRKHRGLAYIEKGEKISKNSKDFFKRKDKSDQVNDENEEPKDDEIDVNDGPGDDIDRMSMSSLEVETRDIGTSNNSDDNSDQELEMNKEYVENDHTSNKNKNLDHDPAIKRIESLLSKHLEKLNLLTNSTVKDTATIIDKDKEKENDEVEDIVLKLKTCRSMEDLCIIGGFSMYRTQQKIICDVCDEAFDNVTKRGGEFSYNFEETGIDFNDCNMPRKFRAFKERVINHIKTKAHKDAVVKQNAADQEEAANEIYNYKVGMKLGSMIYQNVKERCSYKKYERDVAAAALNGEDVGNIRHGEGFAKELVEDMGTQAKIEITKYFHKILPCTGELPPVCFASDKMTMKKKTGHIAGVITPDISTPLSEPLLKPVFLAMPITRNHDGEGLAKQILEIMNLFLSDVTKQVQSVCNDGQYVHLNIKKHLQTLVPDFKDQENWLQFSWDPAHRIALASNDATKNNADGTKTEGSLKDVFDLVQTINKHVSYGKHNLELESILESLGITDKNKPLTFSDTRFPQYAYFVLRNFLNSYPALIQQMEHELTYIKDAKSTSLANTLYESTTIEFVVKVAGATDIFRRQQILSQQSQKVDQLISDVYGNIRHQKEKLEQMNEDLKSDKHPDNWRTEDIEKMDDHLWVETRKALKEIVENKAYKNVALNRINPEEIGIAIVELRNHLDRNISALKNRFKHDFDSEFVQEVKDAFDFNYMIDIMEEVNVNEITSEQAYEEIKIHGNNAIKALLKRKNKANPVKPKEITTTINEYKKVKEFAFKVLTDQDMDRNKRRIKEYCIERKVL